MAVRVDNFLWEEFVVALHSETRRSSHATRRDVGYLPTALLQLREYGFDSPVEAMRLS